MSWRVEQADCVEQMRAMDVASVDAVVCDPPYGIRFMGQAWDGADIEAAARARAGQDLSLTANEAFQAWCKEWAGEALRVLKPGGHMLAFGGTRTYHRLAAGIEDAGFEIRDCLAWLFGSGFPKSLNVGKATDAAEWDGWGTALKPAHEPIVVARKPLVGTVAANVLEHGTGGLNIDGCRIDTVSDGPGSTPPTAKGSGRTMEGGEIVREPYDGSRGRWPANVVLDEAAAATLDEQSGELVSGKSDGFSGEHRAEVYGRYARNELRQSRSTANRGGASRFFYRAKVSRAERNVGLEGFDAKALNWSAGDQSPGTFQSDGTDKTARNSHPTVKPIALMRWLVRLITPPGAVVLDPFTGSGTSGCAAVLEGVDFVGIEREAEYVAIAQARIAHVEKHSEDYLAPAPKPAEQIAGQLGFEDAA